MPDGVTSDLDSSPRFVDLPFAADTGSGDPPLVDMGAYEAQRTDFPNYLPLMGKLASNTCSRFCLAGVPIITPSSGDGPAGYRRPGVIPSNPILAIRKILIKFTFSPAQIQVRRRSSSTPADNRAVHDFPGAHSDGTTNAGIVQDQTTEYGLPAKLQKLGLVQYP